MSNFAAIILNYRNSVLTIRCLNSLVGQGLNSVFIIDNSADECCSQSLKTALQNFKHIDFKIYLYQTNQNLGFAKGVNFALENLDSKYDGYLLINNDAEAKIGMVTKLAAALESNPKLGMVAAKIIPDARLPAKIWYQRFTGLLTAWPLPGSFPYLCGACILIRQELILNNGKLLDEDFFMYGEDVLLGWRLHKNNWDIAEITEAGCQHIGSVSSRQGTIFYEYHLVHGHLLLAQKLATSENEANILLALRIPMLIMRALVRTLRYHSLVPLSGAWRAWLDRRSITSWQIAP